MALDVDALRRKLNQLTGQNKKSNLTWRPEEGREYQIRVLAFPNNDGQPFVDRWYYYGIGGERAPAIMSPHQFGMKDPIQELINRLREDGTDESRELCKKLYPKMRSFAAIVVRGEEDKGVRLWSFGKMIYQDLIKLMLDEDYGDITDPDSGRDLKISVTKQPGKTFADTKVTPRATQTPLSKDPGQAKQWMSTIPNMKDYDEILSADEIEKRVNDWLNGSTSAASEPTRRTEVTDARSKLDTLNELDEVVAPKKAAPNRSAGTAKKAFDEIEDAFNELD
jgi:hypothetical protein